MSAIIHRGLDSFVNLLLLYLLDYRFSNLTIDEDLIIGYNHFERLFALKLMIREAAYRSKTAPQFIPD